MPETLFAAEQTVVRCRNHHPAVQEL